MPISIYWAADKIDSSGSCWYNQASCICHDRTAPHTCDHMMFVCSPLAVCGTVLAVRSIMQTVVMSSDLSLCCCRNNSIDSQAPKPKFCASHSRAQTINRSLLKFFVFRGAAIVCVYAYDFCGALWSCDQLTSRLFINWCLQQALLHLRRRVVFFGSLGCCLTFEWSENNDRVYEVWQTSSRSTTKSSTIFNCNRSYVTTAANDDQSLICERTFVWRICVHACAFQAT